ncbi:DASH family cryptochrome [Alcanivorax sp. JB21]|uniref:DASH family cryptochrome n=1 Tax=Alcanivorax limicola TaxID=2874102 RepID=UPI001CBFD6B7|nr:DASH family cryptochrome [Alcanivorax limicola]MBZ2190142.1 DASH family cryptochrome [Alcanivorax limicola]
MTTLFWFRNDLRVDDNPALLRACADGRVVPVYCLERSRRGTHRQRFLCEALHDLHQQLRQRGSHLVVRHGAPADALTALAHSVKARRIVTSWQPGTEEAEVLALVQRALPDIPVDVIENDGLFRRAQLPFALDNFPRTFTAFRKKIEAHADSDLPLDAPDTLPPVADAALALDQGVPSSLHSSLHSPSHSLYVGGETAAWQRLQHYFRDSKALRHYKETRNGLLGIDYSSKFSPWLAHGCLSPRRIVAEVRCFEADIVKNDSTYWLVFELLWREYFRWLSLFAGARLFRFQGMREHPAPVPDFSSRRFTAWCQGNTGMPFVDANMRELNATGFMSNRGRQNVASFLIHDLQQDWRLGAAWFEQQLLDYDVASNWGNWAYIAGVGSDPRQGRWFNVLGQALRYDPQGDYVSHWLPELAGLPPARRHMPFIENAPIESTSIESTAPPPARDYPDLIIPVPEGWRDTLPPRKDAAG